MTHNSSFAADDRCSCCGNWTQKGRDKMVLRAREHPIYETNLARPCSELTNEIRDKLTEFRGNFSDMRRAYPVWEQLESIEGLLTCAISYLYSTVDDMRKNEARHD